ncbi:MAG: hypothetical protein IJ745_03350 [Bacteroidales bacterium]|nr:hypothetical protein [Bacteroidales bacterium]
MKHIADKLKDASAIIGIVAILGFTAFFSCNANAQNLYQIEQHLDSVGTVTMLTVNAGWDVHLIQTPTDTPSRLVLTTSCADFFEEGHEPNVLETIGIKRLRMNHGYVIKANETMPRSTKVELYTSQPINYIKLYKGARLTIDRMVTDTRDIDISADSGAIINVDCLDNPGDTKFSLHNATLQMHHLRSRYLHIHAYGASVVTEGDVRADKQILHRGKTANTDITANDSAQNIYVKYHKYSDHHKDTVGLFLGLGYEFTMPVWSNVLHASPYNTNFGHRLHLLLSPSAIPLGHNFNLRLSLDFAWNFQWLDNTVAAQDGHLVLDPSFGAERPRQYLYYTSLGLPIAISYSLPRPKRLSPVFKSVYLSLTPTLNFKQKLASYTLDEDDRWHRHSDRVDILNRFNVRAAVGLDVNFLGFKGIEFGIDLLPTFKSSADAPQTRLMGLQLSF